MRGNLQGVYSVLWKVPMRGELRLSLDPEFSGPVETHAPTARVASAAALQTLTLKSPALRGQTLRIRGLENTLTDVLARVTFQDGSQWTARLTARAPSAVIPEQPTAAAVSGVYFLLGVEHILFGFDHLLFVLPADDGGTDAVAAHQDDHRVHRRPFDHPYAGGARVRAGAAGTGRGGDRAVDRLRRGRGGAGSAGTIGAGGPGARG